MYGKDISLASLACTTDNWRGYGLCRNSCSDLRLELSGTLKIVPCPLNCTGNYPMLKIGCCASCATILALPQQPRERGCPMHSSPPFLFGRKAPLTSRSMSNNQVIQCRGKLNFLVSLPGFGEKSLFSSGDKASLFFFFVVPWKALIKRRSWPKWGVNIEIAILSCFSLVHYVMFSSQNRAQQPACHFLCLIL